MTLLSAQWQNDQLLCKTDVKIHHNNRPHRIMWCNVYLKYILSLRMTWCKICAETLWIWPSHWILRHSFSNFWSIQCCGKTGGTKSWFVQSNHVLYLSCTERPAQGSVIWSEIILPVYKLVCSYVQMNLCEVLLYRRVKVSFYAAYHNLMNCPIDIRNMTDPRNCKTTLMQIQVMKI